MDNKPWGAGVGLSDVFEFWVSVFKSGWRMGRGGLTEDFIKIRSLNFSMPCNIDVGD